jgi:hypothetical protein
MKTDRREFPRVDVKFPVEIVQPNGEVITATALNISRTGLQLGCDSQTAERIVKEARQMGEGQPPETFVRLHLPFSETTPELMESRSQIVWSRKVPESGFRIGLRFVVFTGDGEAAVGRFIEESMRY